MSLENEHPNRVCGKNGIWAAMLAHSVNPWGEQVMSMRLHYPRFIHAEFMTHRMFTRNASSSRAIPVRRMLDQVKHNPAKPVHWGQNQAGMQANGEHDAPITLPDFAVDLDKTLENGYTTYIDVPADPDFVWEQAMESAAYFAEALADAGYHKQVCNRLLEPGQYMNVVMSTTDIANFFALRVHPDADPNIKELSACMYEAYIGSIPQRLQEYEWHLPYIESSRMDNGELHYFLNGERCTLNDAIMVSVSCAAQSSYRRLDTSIDKAKNLFLRLSDGCPIHASPFEHPCRPFNTGEHDVRTQAYMLLKEADVFCPEAPLYCGNFRGWTQYRKMMTDENIMEIPEYVGINAESMNLEKKS